MLIEEKAARRRWAEYFEKLLNVQDGVQASVVAVGGDRRMPVLGSQNVRGVESYEVEEGMSKIKGGKAPRLNQCAVEFLRKGGRTMVARLVRLLNCCFETGRVPRTDIRHALSSSIRDKETDASAVTPGS